ncbi:hypothetical protein HYH03_007901 [Edaphochlamys debaryana]|uniref:Uncharacterized protein n=1 Tax=Edaphochlamys debaryana TaxID=47281 RepID=A0A836C011_9CHLO|nr:hypothetical protein HYH03_007901 [Edaphochlamys debaryana]|eukprot:KAG2493974.1 hypothetical protein HYH03_007901 [Edaphochlamys debaryana]
MDHYKALYTKHLAKKRKTWEDGFLVVNGGNASLYDASGRLLQSGVRLPADTDGHLSVFAGLLVTKDDPCPPSDLPAGIPGGTGSAPASAPAPAAAAMPAQKPSIARLPKVAKRGGHAFMCPRPLTQGSQPSQDAAAPASASATPHAPCGPANTTPGPGPGLAPPAAPQQQGVAAPQQREVWDDWGEEEDRAGAEDAGTRLGAAARASAAQATWGGGGGGGPTAGSGAAPGGSAAGAWPPQRSPAPSSGHAGMAHAPGQAPFRGDDELFDFLGISTTPTQAPASRPPPGSHPQGPSVPRPPPPGSASGTPPGGLLGGSSGLAPGPQSSCRGVLLPLQHAVTQQGDVGRGLGPDGGPGSGQGPRPGPRSGPGSCGNTQTATQARPEAGAGAWGQSRPGPRSGLQPQPQPQPRPHPQGPGGGSGQAAGLWGSFLASQDQQAGADPDPHGLEDVDEAWAGGAGGGGADPHRQPPAAGGAWRTPAPGAGAVMGAGSFCDQAEARRAAARRRWGVEPDPSEAPSGSDAGERPEAGNEGRAGEGQGQGRGAWGQPAPVPAVGPGPKSSAAAPQGILMEGRAGPPGAVVAAAAGPKTTAAPCWDAFTSGGGATGGPPGRPQGGVGTAAQPGPAPATANAWQRPARAPNVASAPRQIPSAGAEGLAADASAGAAAAPGRAAPPTWMPPSFVGTPAVPANAGNHNPAGAVRGSVAGGGTGGGSNAGSFSALMLPPLDQPALPRRLVAIPARFNGPEHYRSVMIAALVEEVNLRLAEPVQQLYGHVRRLLSRQEGTAGGPQQQAAPNPNPGWGRPGQGQGQGQGQHGRGPGGGGGGNGFAVAAANSGGAGGSFVRLPPAAQAAELERAATADHLPYFASCTLTCWANRDQGNGRGGGKKKRGKGGGDDDGEEGGDAKAPAGPRYYLTVPTARSRLKNTGKYDLWIISSDPLLRGSGLQGPSAAAGGPRGGGGGGPGWRLAARSLWHGPDHEGRFEIELLTCPPPGSFRSQAVFAMRGPEVQSELQMVQLLQALTPPAAAAAAAAAAAGGTNGAGGGGSILAPSLLRHMLAVHAPEPQMDLAAAAAAAAAGGGGRTGAFKKPRLGQTAAGTADASPSAGPGDADGGGGQDDGEAEDGAGASRGAAGTAAAAPPTVAFDPAAIARAHARRFRLNPDQTQVLLHCASWFKPQAGTVRAPHGDGNGAKAGAGAGRKRSGGAKAGAEGGAELPAAASVSDGEGSDDEDDFVTVPWRKRVAGRATGLEDGAAASKEEEEQEGEGQEDGKDEDSEDDLLPRQGRSAGGVKAGAGRRRRALESDGEEDGKGGPEEGEEEAVAGPPLEPKPPVCLVHGPFGSGKSSLLVALILTLVEIGRRQQAALAAAAAVAAAAAGGGKKRRGGRAAAKAGAADGPPLVRVLMASHTNVAVDRVMMGLQDAGFSDFLRLGSVDRIARPVLAHSLRAGDSSRDAAAELRRALKDASSPQDAALIQAELVALAAGAERQRRRALRTVPVVGATVCSLLQPGLEDACGGGFTVVVLDEASQMTEPLCLVPLLRARARFLVAAGDPLQLPPVIASPATLTPAPGSSATGGVAGGPGGAGPAGGGHLDSLLRPLFVRLSQLGHDPHLLSFQYRCHPLLSGIANAAFYGGRLRDGCSAHQRPRLLPRLPALAVVEGGGAVCVDGATRSSYNLAEAQLVARAVAALLRQGVAAEAVGVICFYRAQVNAVRRALQQLAPDTRPPQAPPQGQDQGQGGGSGEDGGGGGDAGGRGGSAVDVQVATVDSFQGAEKEVILLATTVSRAADFAADAKRLNVALTRGRRHLVLVGSSAALSSTSPVFRNIITMAQEAMRPGGHGDAVYVSAAGLHRLLEATEDEGPDRGAGGGAGGRTPTRLHAPPPQQEQRQWQQPPPGQGFGTMPQPQHAQQGHQGHQAQHVTMTSWPGQQGQQAWPPPQGQGWGPRQLPPQGPPPQQQGQPWRPQQAVPEWAQPQNQPPQPQPHPPWQPQRAPRAAWPPPCGPGAAPAGPGPSPIHPPHVQASPLPQAQAQTHASSGPGTGPARAQAAQAWQHRAPLGYRDPMQEHDSKGGWDGDAALTDPSSGPQPQHAREPPRPPQHQGMQTSATAGAPSPWQQHPQPPHVHSQPLQAAARTPPPGASAGAGEAGVAAAEGSGVAAAAEPGSERRGSRLFSWRRDAGAPQPSPLASLPAGGWMRDGAEETMRLDRGLDQAGQGGVPAAEPTLQERRALLQRARTSQPPQAVPAVETRGPTTSGADAAVQRSRQGSAAWVSALGGGGEAPAETLGGGVEAGEEEGDSPGALDFSFF